MSTNSMYKYRQSNPSTSIVDIVSIICAIWYVALLFIYFTGYRLRSLIFDLEYARFQTISDVGNIEIENRSIYN